MTDIVKALETLRVKMNDEVKDTCRGSVMPYQLDRALRETIKEMGAPAQVDDQRHAQLLALAETAGRYAVAKYIHKQGILCGHVQVFAASSPAVDVAQSDIIHAAGLLGMDGSTVIDVLQRVGEEP